MNAKQRKCHICEYENSELCLNCSVRTVDHFVEREDARSGSEMLDYIYELEEENKKLLSDNRLLMELVEAFELEAKYE